MNFASDNTGPVHPDIMAALATANAGYAMPYGGDPITTQAVEKIRGIFEAPDAAVHFVSTGTAANSILLSCLTQPWETVFCHRHAHINEDECNAPELFMGGAKLTLIDGADAKFDAHALRSAIEGEETRGVHGPQRGPVSITQATEKGAIYNLDEIQAITKTAAEFGLKTHMDGARFANALVSLGCSPAEMTWKSGVDAVSFGGTKNGCMAVEAMVIFDPKKSWEMELRRKRAAQLFSKHRYLSAQMNGYLADDLWLDLARASNAAARELADGLTQIDGVEILHPVQANIIFARWPRHLHQKLIAAGANYYVMAGDPDHGPADELLPARLVCDWSGGSAPVNQFLSLMQG